MLCYQMFHQENASLISQELLSHRENKLQEMNVPMDSRLEGLKVVGRGNDGGGK